MQLYLVTLKHVWNEQHTAKYGNITSYPQMYKTMMDTDVTYSRFQVACPIKRKLYQYITEYSELNWSVCFFVCPRWDKQPKIDCTDTRMAKTDRQTNTYIRR